MTMNCVACWQGICREGSSFGICLMVFSRLDRILRRKIVAVQCRFNHIISRGSKLELPLWLAKGLFDNKRRILSVELPKIYQEGWRTVFSADANVVDLHKMGPHFYGFGSQLLHFDSPENADISQSLLQTFIGRFRRIMDSSQNAYNEDTSALVARLDEMERGLFQTGQKGLNDFQCWEKGQASQITASNLVQNYKKRKFTDMED
ncbi:DNA replication complex GINS protein PSF3 isoform X2 [Camelus ferus]|uniref:DNA replication complex GINS protein PSF3 n=3 Tax=Camelus TaxID=9836 RepID=A0A8B8TJB2_CAMFR|nr:DNA replication complex GINS protein PSF3 isoform X2 [Camelus dromedarius]XP_032342329.1 DNA replication complex GINS protein PSF3 isoform X2 [Camelus ferus]XP_045360527.1 DNA replication complex GINS protein PSF3 isoform X2 [Camelus bactrianus]